MSIHMSMPGCCCSKGNLKKIFMNWEWRGWLPFIDVTPVFPYYNWGKKYLTLSITFENTPFGGGSSTAGSYTLSHDYTTGLTIATVTGDTISLSTSGMPTGFGKLPIPVWAVQPDWTDPTATVTTTQAGGSFVDYSAERMYYEYTAADTLNDGFIEINLTNAMTDQDLYDEMVDIMDTEAIANFDTPSPDFDYATGSNNVIIREIKPYGYWDGMGSLGAVVDDNGWDSTETSYYAARATYHQSDDPGNYNGIPLPSYTATNWVTSLPTSRILYQDSAAPSALIGDTVAWAYLPYYGSHASPSLAGQLVLLKSRLKQLTRPANYCISTESNGKNDSDGSSESSTACSIVAMAKDAEHDFARPTIEPQPTGEPRSLEEVSYIYKDYQLTAGGCPCAPA